MQLARSTLYPAITLHPSAIEQQNRIDIIEARLEDRRQASQRNSDITDQRNVSARGNRGFGVDSDSQNHTIIPVIIQPAANTQRELTGLPQLPLGQSSSSFLTQQLAQSPTDTALASPGTVYQDATSAYGNTLGLTATVMGMHDFKGRSI